MSTVTEMIEARHARARDVLDATEAQVERGLELHRELFVCDCFGFGPKGRSAEGVAHVNQVIDEGAPADEVTETLMDVDALAVTSHAAVRDGFLEVLRASGVNCYVETVGVGPSLHRGLRHMARYDHIIDSLPGHLTKAITAADVRAATEAGKVAMVWSANSPPAMGPFHDGYEALRWMEAYQMFGVRMMHLTYNRRNWVAGGCTDRANAGLSDFGVEVVQKMNSMGVMVDTSHASGQATLDACEFSRAPVVASHAACRDLYDHPRGKTDAELKALAETGGMMGICCIPWFLGAPVGTLRHMLDHIDHVVKLVGAEHVGIGTDTGFPVPSGEDAELKPMPRGRKKWWAHWPGAEAPRDPAVHEEMHEGSLAWANHPWFTVGLVTLGYDDDAIANIIGANYLRVMEAVEKAADPLYRRAP